VRTVGVIALWFALGLGVTELVALGMEQVLISARTTHQLMAYTPPNPLLTRMDLVAQVPQGH
jgi:hypothetical protein